jgi:elongation factor G
MTAEAAAARMTPEEAKRLSQVRNIGIAVGDASKMAN